MILNPERPWQTADELDYLARIGSWSTDRKDRTALLQTYLRMLDLRPKSERYLDFGKLRKCVKGLLDGGAY